MPLSIFSSSAARLAPVRATAAAPARQAVSGAVRLASFIAGFGLTILAASLAVRLLAPLPWAVRDIQGEAYQNGAIAERYAMAPEGKRIVIVGSSVTTQLPPEGFRPPEVATLFMQGSGAMTGLEIVRRSGAAPELILVEADFAQRGIDEAVISRVFDPFMYRLRRLLPAFRDEFNPVNLLAKANIQKIGAADRPPVSVAEWRETIRPRLDHYIAELNRPSAATTEALAALQRQVAELEARGSRIVFFFDPLDPEIAATREVAAWRETMRAAFPRHQFVLPPPEPLHLTDGLHFFAYSGLQYFEYLLGAAGADRNETPGQIRIERATYGLNCGALAGNLTHFARRTCRGRQGCEIGLDGLPSNDPAPGCDKNLVVQWRCGPGESERVSALGATTPGNRLALSCTPADR